MSEERKALRARWQAEARQAKLDNIKDLTKNLMGAIIALAAWWAICVVLFV